MPSPNPLFAALLVATVQDGPADLTERFVVADGLEVTLWAESPQLFNPTAMDVDARGRVWVAEAVNYRRWDGRNPGREHAGGDRVVILEDTDGDGSADASKVFVQDPELVAPLGICVLGERVFVSCSPNVFVYVDRDGDDVPDERRVFLTGFGGYDHDHGVHSVVAGDDGWLYVAVGNAGPHLVTDAAGFELRSGSMYTGGSPYNAENRAGLVSSDGRIWVGGLVLRVRPDGTGLGVVAHNFRNPYEVARDSYGNLFTADNDDDGNRSCRAVLVVEGASYGYFSRDGTRSWLADRRPGQETTAAHWHADDPGVMTTWTITGAGGPTGVAVYEGGVEEGPLARLRGAVLDCDAGAGVVYAHRLAVTENRAALELLEGELLRRTDASGRARGAGEGSWFRPSDVLVQLDGSVLVADWYDPGVGGHAMGDREAYGRILRVAPRGAPRAPMPIALPAGDADALADALHCPAPSVRASAREKLEALGEGAFEALERMAKGGDPRIVARVLPLLARISERGAGVARGATSHLRPGVRTVAYHALVDVGYGEIDAVRQQFGMDRSASVRAALARSLRNLAWDEYGELLVVLARETPPGDRAYLESIGIGLEGKESRYFEYLAGQFGVSMDREYFDMMWRLHPPEAVPQLAKRANERQRRLEVRAKMIDALAFVPTREAADAVYALAHVGPEDTRAQAQWWLRHNAAGDWRAFEIAPASGEGLEDATLAWSSGVLEGGIVDLDVEVAGGGRVWLVVTDGGDGRSCDWADWIEPRFVLEGGESIPLTSLDWLEESCGWGSTQLGRNCDDGPLAVGAERFEDGIGTHAPARLSFAVPPGARRLVARAGPDLGGTSQAGGTSIELQVWTRGGADRSAALALRARVLAADAGLEARVAAATELAADPEGGLFLIRLAEEGRLDEELERAVAPAILANPDLAVRALASAHFPQAADRTLPAAAQLAALEGDARRGRQVFLSERAKCASCHAYAGQGLEIGPDLTAIREKYGASEILEAIVDPSAAIALGYDTYVIATTDGRLLSGFLLAEGEDVVLRDTQGRRHVVRADEVEAKRRQELSAMPAGVALELEPQEIADLVAFLREDPARAPELGEPIELFDGRGLAGWTYHLADGDTPPSAVWTVEDGVLRCAGQPIGYLRTEADYTNFELTLEWRFDPARGPGNSGVLLRMVGPDEVWPESIEAQLHSGDAGDIWNIDRFPMIVEAARTEGRRTAKMLPSNEKPLGEWNRYRIRLDRGELTLEVNGLVQNTASWCAEVPGKVCLQSEGAYIEFRSILLRPIVN